MTLALTEKLRAQLERPLLRRHPLFVLFSLLIGFPCSLLWAFLASLRMRRRRRLSAVPGTDHPLVVSVGNVAVGGTGKSPVVRALARSALARGYDVAILSRGSGDGSQKGVSLRLSADASSMDAVWTSRLADEAFEHALLLSGTLDASQRVWIAQGANRAHSLAEIVRVRSKDSAQEFNKPLFVLLDDGLSQTSLAVHCDVVVWDPLSLLQAPRVCLPFGPYRMGWPGRWWASTLPPEDVRVWSRVVNEDHTQEFFQHVAHARQRLGGTQPESATHTSVTHSHVPSHAVPHEVCAHEHPRILKLIPRAAGRGFDLEPVDESRWPATCAVLTGLARPERFLQTLSTLRSRAARVQQVSVFEVHSTLHGADHGQFTDTAQRFVSNATAVLTSMKDACRWWCEPVFVDKIRRGEIYVISLEIELRLPYAESLDFDVFDLLNTRIRSGVSHGRT